MQESPNGNLKINGLGENIDKKRFFLISFNFPNTTDKFFKLNISNSGEIDMKFSLKQKDFIGSKFFRRKFLTENNIQFNPHSYNPETLFLLNALMITENISVTNEFFITKLL